MMAIMGSKRHPRRAEPQGLVMMVVGMMVLVGEGRVEVMAQETGVLVETAVAQAAGPVAAMAAAPIRPGLYARQEQKAHLPLPISVPVAALRRPAQMPCCCLLIGVADAQQGCLAQMTTRQL